MTIRIVIIGQSGQIAQALHAHLPGLGHEVITLARPEIDLERPETVMAALASFSPALIINPAAYTAVDKAEAEPELALRINRDGARAVAEAAHAVGAALIHVSTDYVFDGTKVTPYLETDRPAPLGSYGRSKLAGEQAVWSACPRSVILRTSWLCSPHGSNFVKTMLRLAGERDELRVVSDQFGRPTFASCIAMGIGQMLPLLLAEDGEPQRFGIFHMANAGETSWHGFAEAIMVGARQRGAASVPVRAITSEDYPTPAQRPANSRLSTEKLRRVYGVELPHWREGLEMCLDSLIGCCQGLRHQK